MSSSGRLIPVEWLLCSVYPPQGHPIPIGILLIDHQADALSMRIRHNVGNVDDDIQEVLTSLTDDLQADARASGALCAIERWENDWSHTFRLGRRHAHQAFDVGDLLAHLFEQHVVREIPDCAADLLSSREIGAACSRLTVSPGIAESVLFKMRDLSIDLAEIEEMVERDPLLIAHLIKAANSALYGMRKPVRTTRDAISRLGTQTASWYVAALSARHHFRSAAAKPIWNHSIEVAQVASRLAEAIGGADIGEVRLITLMHDMGRVVLQHSDEYEYRSSKLRNQGRCIREIELQLCGVDHGEIGARLLNDWSFPQDMVTAVRMHHLSEVTDHIGCILYLSEHLSQGQEDIPKKNEAARVAKRVGTSLQELKQFTLGPPILELHFLRMATSA